MTNFVKFHLMASPDMSTSFYVWEDMLEERAFSYNIPLPPCSLHLIPEVPNKMVPMLKYFFLQLVPYEMKEEKAQMVD